LEDAREKVSKKPVEGCQRFSTESRSPASKDASTPNTGCRLCRDAPSLGRYGSTARIWRQEAETTDGYHLKAAENGVRMRPLAGNLEQNSAQNSAIKTAGQPRSANLAENESQSWD
jgi:hypothetical protein